MLTPHAILSMERLSDSWFINWIVRGSIHDPSMGGSDHHLNWRFFGAMERYLSVQQVCHAADALNSYCDSVLAEILQVAPSEWDNVKTILKRKDIADAINCLQSHRQSGAREALRDRIQCFWSPESDVICVLRNKLVHQGGNDPKREVDGMITSKNGQWCPVSPVDLPAGVIPIAYDGDDLVIDAQTGFWACRHVQNHIHLMDQNLSHRYRLATARYRPRSLKYSSRSNHHSLPSPPGTPLPTSKPPMVVRCAPPTPQINPDYFMITDQKEVSCAQARLKTRNDLDGFVRKYCDEAGVEITGVNGGMPGSVHAHTIRGHDLSLEYQLQPRGALEGKKERVQVRIRERELEPFLTIFSNSTQMRDFYLPKAHDDAIEYLKTCIDRALQ